MAHSMDKAQPNFRLRDARLERGWTQAKVVEKLDELATKEGYPQLYIDPGIVCKWERGKLRPGRHHIFLLSKLYNKSANQLGWEENAKNCVTVDASSSSLSSVTIGDMQRRNLMIGSVGATTLTMISSLGSANLERISHFLIRPKAADEATVSALEAQTLTLRSLQNELSSAQLFPYLSAHLNQLKEILSGTVPSKLRQRLITTTGIAASISGWLAWDKGDSATSQQLYRIASDASYEASEPALFASCMGDMSYIPSSRGNPQQAERMLARGLDRLNSTTSPRISAWLQARRAEELALLNNEAALALLDDSFRNFTPENPKSEVSFLTPTRMDTFALNVNLHLGRHNESESLAKKVMTSVTPSSTLRPVILADVATAYLKSGNFEQGTEIAGQAYQAAAQSQSQWALSRLNNLNQLLLARAPHDSGAAELAAQFGATKQ